MKNTGLKISLSCLIVAAFFLGACSEVGGQSSASSFAAKDFTLSTLDGESFNLKDTLKDKDAVLVFFATWCPPCRREAPHVESYYQQNMDKVAVLGINVQESSAKVAAFAKGAGLNYPIAIDTTGQVAREYGVRGIPTVVAINKKGQIIYSGHDIIEMSRKVDFSK